MTFRPILTLLLITGSMLACDKDKPASPRRRAPAAHHCHHPLRVREHDGQRIDQRNDPPCPTVTTCSPWPAPRRRPRPSATVAASASAPPGAKEYTCGAKGQPKCPPPGLDGRQHAAGPGLRPTPPSSPRRCANRPNFAPPGATRNWAQKWPTTARRPWRPRRT